jgi:NitT/TauT family transport system substrate-binding protein
VFRSPYATLRPWRHAHRNFTINLIVFALVSFASASAGAEAIKIGVLKVTGAAPVFDAQEKGYFAAEGVPAELVYFDASQPIAIAVTSGAIDFGITGFTAGFYNLAGQGELKVIGGGYAREAPGFHNQGYVASNQAYAGGLTALKDFPGHSLAISQIGSPPHYALGLLMEKYGLDAKTIRLLPLQSVANMSSAVSGGQADAAIMTAAATLPLVQHGDAKLLGWVGDETPWEFGAAFAATRTANDRRDTVERFLRAWRKGAHDCHDAFAGADEKPTLGPAAPEMLAIIAQYTGLPTETIKLGLPYCDPEARLEVTDVLHQIAWYKAQGMLKADVDGATIIDQRYVVPLAGP